MPVVDNMIIARTVVLSVLVGTLWCAEDEDLSFPAGFRFGAASAAHQVEGAWNISDKSENIWDRFTHSRPDVIVDGSNADVTCDSYHLWRRDVHIAKELGLHYYRFSIAWTRLLPHGFANYTSEDGKNYYNNLIDELLKNGIEPVVTLYHWDLPQCLQDLGGWTNPQVADWFSEYARVAFSLYADRVKTWITLNEPIIFCDLAYNTGLHAPGLKEALFSPYQCNKNALMAHAKAWRIYDKEFRSKYHGEISLCNHMIWFEPATPEDEELAELARQNLVGRYSHPIYSKEGGWPPSIEKLLADNSKKQGYTQSRLPAFTQQEKEFVKGTFDFYGFNMYTSRLIRKAREGEEIEPWPMSGAPELSGMFETSHDWKPTSSWWFLVNPPGMRSQLAWLKKQYGDIKVFITENGYASASTGLDDSNRVEFYRDHLKQVLLSIREDGVNVMGYTAWTLLDNYEWADGYVSKFGLYEVDFEDPQRTRTPRKSAHFYAHLIKKHSLDF